MPVKIITDQPQARRRTIQHLVTTDWVVVAEAPYFSVPLTDEDIATLDPANPDRELRPGEVFLASAMQIANTTANLATVEVEMVGEAGQISALAPGLLVPGNDVLTLTPGLSVFKRDLAAPTADGGRIRVRASAANALTLTTTVIEREALEHAPDTEGAL